MKRIFVFSLVLLFLACAKKVVEKPENLIPKDKMAEILHDLAVLDAAKSSFKATLDRKDIKIMDFIYEKHQIDSAQFAQSDLYYASIPLEYQFIYEAVEGKLEDRRKILEEATQMRNDSVRKSAIKRKDSLQKTKK
ncbi:MULTISPECIES: DUF4296 domain-containing protein [Flavobacteriaceae]|uniref:DUF4296 domain-containing protein n=1 Tax=Flavobacteriaceae TaxID=49546 RepID=UPI001491D8FA|nr:MULTISPECIES: DUF4296 domain-containing protein [Allomuricauda]MDC6365472.1 DUF4296 domain-containing protein [Muricauda sp. AC10]